MHNISSQILRDFLLSAPISCGNLSLSLFDHLRCSASKAFVTYGTVTPLFSTIDRHIGCIVCSSYKSIGSPIDFGGTANYVAFDDITFGSDVPGNPGVPEPATWALLIAGFGLVGAAARRRRALTA